MTDRLAGRKAPRLVHAPVVDGPRERLMAACFEFCDAMTLVKHTVGHYGFDDGAMAMLLKADDMLGQVTTEDVDEILEEWEDDADA